MALSIKNKRPAHQPILRKVDNYATILLVLDKTDVTIETQLKSTFPNAKISLLLPRVKKETNAENPNYSYHSSDINFLNKIKNEKLNKLLSTKFDLVVDLSTGNKLNKMLLDKLNQTFMIGKGNEDKSYLYDLILENTIPQGEIIPQIKNLLTILSQNGN